MNKDPIVIVEAVRTPMGSFQSSLKDLSAVHLGTAAVRALLHMTNLPKEAVSEVIMGSVLQAGQGQAPARQVALKSDLPFSVGATTVNKVCGSGMKAVMMGANQIMAEDATVVIAGGMESMSQAPFFIKRPGKKELPPKDPIYLDHLFHDGLHDAYQKGTPMGIFAEATAEKYGFSRHDQDAFATRSVEKAKDAAKQGHFEREIVPLVLKTGDETKTLSSDESVERAKVEKIPELRPAFKENGTITAASASALTDGASAMMIMRESTAKANGLTPRARIVGFTSFGQAPEWFTLAPIGAIKSLLNKVGWKSEDVDLYEINEAFAVVAMAAQKDLGIPDHKLNIHGGACALGHPIGASGARLLTTLISALETHQLNRGVASLCIGGGEAVAMAVERYN
jgi:acetyl-CoA C-acetyltransferase